MRIISLILIHLSLHISAECPYLAVHSVATPPKSKGASRLLGDFPQAQKNTADLMDALLNKYHASIVEVDVPCSPLLNRIFAVLSPTVAQHILLDTSGAFIKGSFEQRTEKNIFPPEGLIWMPSNERWHLLNESLFKGPFNPQSFPNCYAPLFKDAFEWFVQRLERLKEPFDLYRECTYYSMRTMSHTFFNYLLEDDELMAISDAFKFMFTFMHKRETSVVNFPLILPLPRHLLFYHHRATFNRILKKIIAHAPYSVTHNGITYPTIMGILKTHRDPETNTALTEEEIVSHVATLFFAGHDTTANFITMLIYYLSTTPAWYTLIQNELRTNYRNRSLEWLPLDKLTEYSYFKNEILRLFPSVPLVSINTTKQIIIDGYTIPKNSTLLIALHTIHKNPDFFKNPTTFNPHRFNQDDPDYTPYTASSMMPFNFGPRRCLGQWFAQAEAQHLITHLINSDIRFTIEPLKEPLKLTVGLSGMPNQKIFARIQVPEDFYSSREISPESSIDADIQDLPMRIVSIRYENKNKTIKTYRLAPLHMSKLPFSYQPGDHLELIAKNSSDQTVIRHYSISSSPTDSDEWLEITIKKEENPYSTSISQFMHDELIEDSILFVRAPMDDGVRVATSDEPIRPLILISGGIGITPMMSILRYCVAHNWPGEIYCIHSCKAKDDCAFYEELQKLNKEHANIHLIITCTQEREATPDYYRGRISQSLFDILKIPNIQNATIYLCSKESMCSDIRFILEKNYNVPTSSIHHLSFGAINQADYALQKIYTSEEVARHNKRTDAWIIIENIVYDITHYLDKHPGLDIILDYLGKDATNAFNQTSHSAAAKKLLHHSEFITIVGRIEYIKKV